MKPLAELLAAQSVETAGIGVRGQVIDYDELQTLGVAAGIDPETHVALRLHNPLDVIRALAALDGQVAGILLLSHALPLATALELARSADCTMLVLDELPLTDVGIDCLLLKDVLGIERRSLPLATTWVLTTSGTTGLPKIVPHTLSSLSRSVYHFTKNATTPVWGLLYDPTRFAGLQVILQALIGGGQLIAVDTLAPLSDQIAMLVDHNCTHLSATPTLWRRLMMVPQYGRLKLRQITLGGEICDQPTLNALRGAFPQARLTHIYASTEAGVGFSVTDGKAGFPLDYLESAPGNVRISIRDGVLWLSPPASQLRPGAADIKVDTDGFICSGDRVEISSGRVFFLGRENGMINIGGVKVYPEAVEAIIKAVTGVALVQVSAKRSPVTGALVLAEVQLEEGFDKQKIREQILTTCRASLTREAVPAMIKFVEGLDMNAAGKLVRMGAK